MHGDTLNRVQHIEVIAKTEPAMAINMLTALAAEHAKVADVDDELFCLATLIRIAIVGRVPELALDAARTTLDRKPTIFHVVQLAHMYERSGNTEQALRVYRYVSSLASQHEMAISERDKRAVLAPPEVTSYLPGSIEAEFLARRDLGVAYLGMGRRDDAISEFEIALSLRPDDEECTSLLGEAKGTSDY